MSQMLLIVERVVLESLEKRELSQEELIEQTGFSRSLLNGTLSLLLSKGIIKRKRGLYFVNWKRKSEWMPIVHNREGVKAELKELFSVMVDQSGTHNNLFKVQKVWLGPKEKDELDRRIKDIENYILSLKERRKTRPVSEKTIGKQVLMLGVSPYENLVQGVLNSA